MSSAVILTKHERNPPLAPPDLGRLSGPGPVSSPGPARLVPRNEGLNPESVGARLPFQEPVFRLGLAAILRRSACLRKVMNSAGVGTMPACLATTELSGPRMT